MRRPQGNTAGVVGRAERGDSAHRESSVRPETLTTAITVIKFSGIGASATVLAVTVKAFFRYLERRDDNRTRLWLAALQASNDMKVKVGRRVISVEHTKEASSATVAISASAESPPRRRRRTAAGPNGGPPTAAHQAIKSVR
jgi:hypothetical protein